MMSDQPM